MQQPLVWLSNALLPILKAEADRCYPLETGGLLLGYRAGNEWVIEDVLGPGPRAEHRRRTFRPDHGWEEEQLGARFREHGGRQIYVGDWHSHPDGGLALSRRDLGALRRVIRSPQSQTDEPLSALLAGTPERWEFAIWAARLEKRGWLRPQVTVTPAQLQRR